MHMKDGELDQCPGCQNPCETGAWADVGLSTGAVSGHATLLVSCLSRGPPAPLPGPPQPAEPSTTQQW